MDILRKVQSPKTEPGRNKNINRPIMSTEIESVIKIPLKKVQDQMASQVNSTKHSEKS